MRSFESIPELLDEYEMTCPYSKCLRTFYTNNSKAVFCCDSHRGKYYREINKDRLKHERDWNKTFMSNAECLKRSYLIGEKLLTERELKLIGFDFKVMAKPVENKEGRTCFIFFNCGIMHHPTKPNLFEIFNAEKM